MVRNVTTWSMFNGMKWNQLLWIKGFISDVTVKHEVKINWDGFIMNYWNGGKFEAFMSNDVSLV